ncbi:MAG: plasmid mobilization relaxosome protein MobC [Chitinophagaceae bacterium]|nr:plasmid mobilization relaxosome protein MobC [Chitinophagaceae bacterium]
MKGQKINRTKRIICRLSLNEYRKLESQFNESTCRKLSDFLRRRLFDRPIVATYRDRSLDDLMTELIKLRNELNNIGNNFNQAVKRLHTLDNISEFRSWIQLYDEEKKMLLNAIYDINIYMKKLGEKWLQ